MSLLAVIPARGGSKGIPRKNIKELFGKPLIAWTIEVAKTVSEIDRLIVSTEDKEIADVARAFGADVPFLRPTELANDESPGIDPVLHALEMFPEYDEVLLLQPTSPLRSTEDIVGIIQMSKLQKASSIVSVTMLEKSINWMYSFEKNNRLKPLMEETLVTIRQNLPPTYALNGALYWAKSSWLLQHKAFINNETLGYVMPKERSVDLDYSLDWDWAEFLIQRNCV